MVFFLVIAVCLAVNYYDENKDLILENKNLKHKINNLEIDLLQKEETISSLLEERKKWQQYRQGMNPIARHVEKKCILLMVLRLRA